MATLKAAPRITGVPFVPFSEFVLVRRDPTKTKTASGIDISDAHAAPTTAGVVLAVGRGRVLTNGQIMTPQAAVGDHVSFGVHSGMEIDLDLGPGLVILQEDELLGKGLD